MKKCTLAFAALASAAGFATGASVLAAEGDVPPCSSLNLPKPLYGSGGSANRPLWRQIGAELAGQADPVTLLYQDPGACFGVYDTFQKKQLSGTIRYWDKDANEKTCTLPAINGPQADFGNLATGYKLCPDTPAAIPSHVAEFRGPVTSFSFFVPVASNETSISAEAAYFVLGWGQEGQVSPWLNTNAIIVRDATSAAAQAIGIAIGLPPTKFKGIDARTNAKSIELVANSPTPQAAIGFASSETVDANRATVKALAFQAKGQKCGYLPDSGPTAFDKKNVREGRYQIWGATYFYARVTPGTRNIENPEVAKVIGYLSGELTPPDPKAFLRRVIKAGNIPLCAMKARREGDITAILPYDPPAPCNCFFEKEATGTTTCVESATDAGCPASAPKSRYGYCEAK